MIQLATSRHVHESSAGTRTISLHPGSSPYNIVRRSFNQGGTGDSRYPGSNMSCILRAFPRPSLAAFELTPASPSEFCGCRGLGQSPGSSRIIFPGCAKSFMVLTDPSISSRMDCHQSILPPYSGTHFGNGTFIPALSAMYESRAAQSEGAQIQSPFWALPPYHGCLAITYP